MTTTEPITDLAGGGDGGRPVARPEVEDFLFHEAHLLDTWQLDAWVGLFVPDARMEVTSTDWQGWDSDQGGSFVADDWDLINARVRRLKSRKAHAENPRSRTHRLVGNVRLTDRSGPVLGVAANFVVHRFRDLQTFSYVGRYEHVLRVGPEGLRMVLRRTVLTHEAMAPGARLSFIL